MNLAKFIRITFLQNISGRLLLHIVFSTIFLKRPCCNAWSRGGSRILATSKMQHPASHWKPLTIIAKCFILDVEASLDPPLWSVRRLHRWRWYFDPLRSLQFSSWVYSMLYQGFERRWMLVELICYIKTIYCFLKNFKIFFRRHFLMNRPWNNDSFEFMQHDNFRNLNTVIFTHWKHLESGLIPFDIVSQ